MKKLTHKALKRTRLKKRIAMGTVIALLSVSVIGAADTFYSETGREVIYSDWFNPDISHTTGHSNAITTKLHSTWVRVGNTYGYSKGISMPNSWAYATAVGAWNGYFDGWYTNY